MGDGSQHSDSLVDLFPVAEDGTSTRTAKFKNKDFDRISSVLEYSGKSAWARVPRTYAVLRMAQALAHLDSIMEKGVSDVSIPYNLMNLPSELLPVERTRFLEAQKLVLTDLMALERGMYGKHLHMTSRSESQFETIAPLGKGGFARVEKVYSKLGQRFYAMKLLSRKTTFKNDQTSLSNFLKELAASKRVDHHHIVKVVGSFTEPKFVGIIMDTVGDCDLETFLDDDGPTPLTSDKVSLLRTFFGCLASGLVAIHDAGIRHKDIKPKNILIRGDTVMYTDFGLALDYSQTNRSTTGGRPAMFTVQFCAPEVANWEDRRTSSDIFSLGAVFLEMATRLNGRSIKDLRGFLKTENEQNSPAYCKNIPALRKWLEQMKADPGRSMDRLPFAWTEQCLNANEKSRPTAHRLWEMIDDDTKAVSSPFACSTCTMFNDSSSSESDSEETARARDKATTKKIIATYKDQIANLERTVGHLKSQKQEVIREFESTKQSIRDTHAMALRGQKDEYQHQRQAQEDGHMMEVENLNNALAEVRQRGDEDVKTLKEYSKAKIQRIRDDLEHEKYAMKQGYEAKIVDMEQHFAKNCERIEHGYQNKIQSMEQLFIKQIKDMDERLAKERQNIQEEQQLRQDKLDAIREGHEAIQQGHEAEIGSLKDSFAKERKKIEDKFALERDWMRRDFAEEQEERLLSQAADHKREIQRLQNIHQEVLSRQARAHQLQKDNSQESQQKQLQMNDSQESQMKQLLMNNWHESQQELLQMNDSQESQMKQLLINNWQESQQKQLQMSNSQESQQKQLQMNNSQGSQQKQLQINDSQESQQKQLQKTEDGMLLIQDYNTSTRTRQQDENDIAKDMDPHLIDVFAPETVRKRIPKLRSSKLEATQQPQQLENRSTRPRANAVAERTTSPATGLGLLARYRARQSKMKRASDG
jgi:serine/threonine protein kinase